MASLFGRPVWFLTYWSRKRLFSPTVRRAWMGPDLKSLLFLGPTRPSRWALIARPFRRHPKR
jgi:hypothetical protein